MLIPNDHCITGQQLKLISDKKSVHWTWSVAWLDWRIHWSLVVGWTLLQNKLNFILTKVSLNNTSVNQPWHCCTDQHWSTCQPPPINLLNNWSTSWSALKRLVYHCMDHCIGHEMVIVDQLICYSCGWCHVSMIYVVQQLMKLIIIWH